MAERKREHTEEVFYTRLKYAKALFFLCFLMIFFHLFKLQVLPNAQISAGRFEGRYRQITLPVPRGTIYDRNGRVLAMSLPFYSVYVDAWAVRHREQRDSSYREKLAEELSRILSMDKKEIETRLNRPYPLIKRELSIEEYHELKDKKLPGVVFERNYTRIYPNDCLASHIIGFTGQDGDGLEGIELYYNSILKGTPGSSLVLADGHGSLIHSVEKRLVNPRPGKDIQLTIDANLQFLLEEELKKAREKYNAKTTSGIIMDYETGEILALASIPSYNLNMPGDSTLSQRRNRVVTDLFEPGSTFKIVTAAAAMEEGIFHPEDIIDCENGKWFVRNRPLRDVHKHGKITVSQVIEKSSNIGTVKMAMELGEQKLYHYCRKFGFGNITGIDLPGEIRGILRPLNRWSGHSIIAIPIGQEVGINAVQGIRAMAVIANGGFLLQPHLLKSIIEDGNTIKTHVSTERERIISKATCMKIRDILEQATLPGGTAPLAHIAGYSVSGKTGTAQKIIDGKYSGSKYIASFGGFLNGKEENLIIQVTIDEPRPVYYGGLVAAPTFRNILWRSLQYLDIPPEMEILSDKKMVMEKKIDTDKIKELSN